VEEEVEAVEEAVVLLVLVLAAHVMWA